MRRLLAPYSPDAVEDALLCGDLVGLLDALCRYFQDKACRVGALEPGPDEAVVGEWRERWERERPVATRALVQIAAGEWGGGAQARRGAARALGWRQVLANPPPPSAP